MTDDVEMADVEVWASGLQDVQARIGRRFSRSEPRARVLSYLRGMLAPLERKNGWTLAEAAGEASPDGMQRLVSTADWDADAVRDDLREYVVARLGDPDGVLVVDETGFLKKGSKSAGVARQYSGTAGRIENCQIGVFLGYASRAGRTFLERELYLPRPGPRIGRVDARPASATTWRLPPSRSWRSRCSPARCAPACRPAGSPATRSTASTLAYAPSARTAACLTCSPPRPTSTCGCGPPAGVGRGRPGQPLWPTRSRRRRSNASAQAPARKAHGFTSGREPNCIPGQTEAHPPMAARASQPRRRRTGPLSLPRPRRDHTRRLARGADARWAIEETFQTSKGEAGLDHYQLRRFDGWYRHITLAMFAHAFLTVTRARGGKKGRSIPT